MLVRLTIQNYALIESLELDFINGLSIITGETGAGKSILLGGLNLILGSRADVQSLYSKEKKCVVEAVFDLHTFENAKDFFETNELDYDRYSIIRREINTDGKSRAFINDTPVTLNVLRQLTEQLVDIHSQRENQALMSSDYRMSVLDAFAGNKNLLADYKRSLSNYRKLNSELELLVANAKQSMANLDYLQFQLNELEALELKEGEQMGMEQELEMINHSEEIKTNLLKAVALANDERGLINLLHELILNTKTAARFHTPLNSLLERLNSVMIESKDIASEIEAAEQEVVFDPARAELLNDRLSRIYKLQHKHQLSSEEELLALQNRLAIEVQSIESLDDAIAAKQKEVSGAKLLLLKSATELTAKRTAIVKVIEDKIQMLLKDLMMPDAKMKIELVSKGDVQFGDNGADTVEWLFAANKGHDFKNITKVASGGELSRVMLCIKAAMAGMLKLPTMIFDEIDTGVSGEVALKVGALMHRIALAHQVITITHLPQIAGKGQSHFYVYKQSSGKQTTTHVKQLTAEERIIQIAKMIGGEHPSDAAYNSAKELLHA